MSLLIGVMMCMSLFEVAAQKTDNAKVKSATPSNSVIALSAKVVQPGKICYAMFTFLKMTEPYKIPEKAFLVYDINVAKESIGSLGGIEFNGGDI